MKTLERILGGLFEVILERVTELVLGEIFKIIFEGTSFDKNHGKILEQL